jgi:cytochrome c-type biogenesis protein CcmH/NrfG
MKPRAPVLYLALFAAVACGGDEAELAAHLERAEAYVEEEEHAAAVIELKNALAQDPENPEINFRLAEVLLSQRKPGLALFYYQESRRLDPRRIEAYLEEARLLRRADPQEARKVLDEALELRPGHGPSYHLLVELAIDRGDPDGALEAARRGAGLAPEDWRSHFQVGRAWSTSQRIRNPAAASRAIPRPTPGPRRGGRS